jgi:FkbM family methyltransferase
MFDPVHRWMPKAVKRVLRPTVAWLRQAYHRMRPAGPDVLRGVLNEMPGDCFFVQIGSNDGQQRDPLHDFILERQWRGILVEPVPYLFQRLKENYAQQKGLIFEGVAISASDAPAEFYFVSQDAKQKLDLPYWFDQLGSFDKGHIIKHFGRAIEPFIVSSHVPTLTFTQLLDKNGVNRVDLLHIDCEGYDYEILKSVDFQRCRPSVIIYEHEHLGAKDKQAALQLLAGLQYACTEQGSDTIARAHLAASSRPVNGAAHG